MAGGITPGDGGIAAFCCFQKPVLASRGHGGGDRSDCGGRRQLSAKQSRRKKLLQSLSRLLL